MVLALWMIMSRTKDIKQSREKRGALDKGIALIAKCQSLK